MRAGLETSVYVSADDTGARHAGKTGFCTQIGNDWFTWFGTRASKSRLNFLDLLRAAHTDYVVNDAALAYMRERALAGPVIRQLAAAPRARFADHAAWSGASRPTRHQRIAGHARSGRHRHRRRAVGGGHGARLLVRCRPVRRGPPRAVLGACRTARTQARHVHRVGPSRSGAHPRP